MNRFEVLPCIEQSRIEDSEYDGMLLPLAAEISNNCVLFFPVNKEIATLINYLQNIEDEENVSNIQVIDVYRTMIDSWKSSGKFLSGILMDMKYDDEVEEDIIDVSFVLSSLADGYVDSVVKVGFVHSIIVAVLEDIDVMVGDALLNKLLPDSEGMDFDEDMPEEFLDPNCMLSQDHLNNINLYPHDDNIAKIAKQIMDGNIK